MKTENNECFQWNKEFALKLESIVKKDPQEIDDEYKEILKRLHSIWEAMANVINYDFSDETVVESIKEHLPAEDSQTIFSLFADQEKALDFFCDYRAIMAIQAIYAFKYTIDSYSPPVQGIIRFGVQLLEAQPIAFEDDSLFRLKAIEFCITHTISEGFITYEILCEIYKIIDDLAILRAGYFEYLEKMEHGEKRSAGKQERVKQRFSFFLEFDKDFENKKAHSPEISKSQFARFFYNKKRENLKQYWRSPDAFYQSLCSRKQPSSKNKGIEEVKKQEAEKYELSSAVADCINTWLHASPDNISKESEDNSGICQSPSAINSDPE